MGIWRNQKAQSLICSEGCRYEADRTHRGSRDKAKRTRAELTGASPRADTAPGSTESPAAFQFFQGGERSLNTAGTVWV